jgi:intracellular multiplication protein IcmL
VKKRKLVVYATQTGNAVVLENSTHNPNLMANGAYTWLVQIPMLLTYENTTEKFTQNTVLTATIVRQSTLVSEKGVGIHSFVSRVVQG